MVVAFCLVAGAYAGFHGVMKKLEAGAFVLVGLAAAGVALAFREWGKRATPDDMSQRMQTTMGVGLGIFFVLFGVLQLIRAMSRG